MTRALDKALADDVNDRRDRSQPGDGGGSEAQRYAPGRRRGRRPTRCRCPSPTPRSTASCASSASCSFPTRPHAFREARRVLRPAASSSSTPGIGSRKTNSRTWSAALATIFPQDPPRFMARTPHGYHDRAAIERDVAAAGFSSRASKRSRTQRAKSALDPAIAYCQGTPCARRSRRAMLARGGDASLGAGDRGSDSVPAPLTARSRRTS